MGLWGGPFWGELAKCGGHGAGEWARMACQTLCLSDEQVLTPVVLITAAAPRSPGGPVWGETESVGTAC